MSRKTHEQIAFALDAILTQGAQILYQSYLQQKLPGDCNQRIVNNIQSTFNCMVPDKPKKTELRRQLMPQPAPVDLICTSKVPIRSKSQVTFAQETNKKIFNTQVTSSASTKQFIRRQNIVSGKPDHSIRTICRKGQVDKAEQQIRRLKIQSDKQKLKALNQKNTPTQPQFSKRDLLQLKIKQLLAEGIPYAYDDQGNYIIPDIKTYKKQLQKQSKKKVPKPFTLRYKAIQLLCEGSDLQNNSSINGRKRGFSSVNSQIERKKKITQKQFTNQYQRQFSAIPYMDVADGVKFVQRQRNIMAEKLRSPTLTRQQYVRQSKKTLFKSFMPTSQGSTFRVSSAGRPWTNAQSRKSLGIMSAASLSKRPKTSKEVHKVNINNKQLAKQLVKQDSILLTKVI